jgi:hypothetical protein
MRHRKGHDADIYRRYANQGYTKAETARALGVSPQCVHDQALRYGIDYTRKCKRGGYRATSNNFKVKVLWSTDQHQEKWEQQVGKYTTQVRPKATVRH